ncbi:MAG: hypothetical protein K2X74_01755, partial [Acetobacteraceae bacterium]|nr:hypothetical protein [Acetobacteraceae bacterium]
MATARAGERVSQSVILEAREPRSRLGRLVRWLFWLFQVVMLAGGLATCGLVVPYAGSEDPEVAAGAGLFAAAALGVIWVIWPVGTLVLGLLLFLTRGRRRLVTLPGA